MPDVPRISGKEAVRAFEKVGFVHTRTTGSHHILKKPGHRSTLSIPVHAGKAVGLGLLRSQIEGAELTIEEFIALL